MDAPQGTGTPSCSANDLDIVSASVTGITKPGGTTTGPCCDGAPGCFTCMPGEKYTGTLVLALAGRGGAERYGLAFYVPQPTTELDPNSGCGSISATRPLALCGNKCAKSALNVADTGKTDYTW